MNLKIKRQIKQYTKLCDRVIEILSKFGELKVRYNFKTMSNEFTVGNFMFWTNSINKHVFGGIASNGKLFILEDFRDKKILNAYLNDVEQYMEDHKGLLIPDFKFEE